MKTSGPGRSIWLAWTWMIDGLLCLLLLAMIILSCLQIILRTFFAGGFLWADPLLRYLVLWSGMLGAVVATREGKHIAIDVVTYLSPGKTKKWIRLLIHLLSFVVSGILTMAAVTFVRNEATFGTNELLNIPSWTWNIIFPVAFALITFHFFISLLTDVLSLFGISINQATRSEMTLDGK